MDTTSKTATTTEKKVSVRRATEEQLHDKQRACKKTRTFWGGDSNIVEGSLRFEETGHHANKQTVEIKTVGVDGKPDGNTRRVATSDLHQVHSTEAVAEELKKAKRREAAKARREKVKAAMELLEAQNAED
jgi:hypothetical protein